MIVDSKATSSCISKHHTVLHRIASLTCTHFVFNVQRCIVYVCVLCAYVHLRSLAPNNRHNQCTTDSLKSLIVSNEAQKSTAFLLSISMQYWLKPIRSKKHTTQTKMTIIHKQRIRKKQILCGCVVFSWFSFLFCLLVKFSGVRSTNAHAYIVNLFL